MTELSVPTRDEVVSARDDLVQAIVGHLAADRRIDAVWLGGSLGRGEGDALSDVDLAVVVAHAHLADLVAVRLELVERAGDVALVLDSPQNSHRDGAQVNVLYDDGLPLPTFVDWSLWPAMRERPTEIRVLYEKAGVGFEDGTRTNDEVQMAMPRGRPPEVTAEYLDRFRLAMAPVTAKLAARGDVDAVRAMFGYMRESVPETYELPTVVEALGGIIERIQLDMAQAKRAVLRYLRLLNGLVTQELA